MAACYDNDVTSPYVQPSWGLQNINRDTHTHTQRERERERRGMVFQSADKVSHPQLICHCASI